MRSQPELLHLLASAPATRSISDIFSISLSWLFEKRFALTERGQGTPKDGQEAKYAFEKEN